VQFCTWVRRVEKTHYILRTKDDTFFKTFFKDTAAIDILYSSLVDFMFSAVRIYESNANAKREFFLLLWCHYDDTLHVLMSSHGILYYRGRWLYPNACGQTPHPICVLGFSTLQPDSAAHHALDVYLRRVLT